MIPSRQECDMPPIKPPIITGMGENSDRKAAEERIDSMTSDKTTVKKRTISSHEPAATKPAVVAPKRV